ncbi:thiamine pyrophosphate-binding protein [Paenibacillus sp. CC-CFT747]|nr:thiamine pyrophosphate-binding protein [Paenibacillus sp. CC-CFT747]
MKHNGNGMPGEDLTVAGYLIAQLEAWGVKRIYGVIGDANLRFLDELSRSSAIRYIACRHEGAAALMASAEAKLTGRIGVCLATSGPGAANLVNGLADAAMDYAGVLAITGQVETSKHGTRTKQFVNQQLLMQALTDQSRELVSGQALPELLHGLLVQALLHGKAAHLSVAKDVWEQKLTGRPIPYGSYLHQPLLTPREALEKAVEELSRAAKPVLYVGSGAGQVKEEVLSLAELLEAAVITTLPARPLFPNDHPRYAGGLGQAGSEAATVILRESDLILMLGATWWPDDYVPTQARLIQIDRSPANLAVGHPLLHGIVGDLADCLPELLAMVRRLPQADRAAWVRRTAGVTAEWNSQLLMEAARETHPLSPQMIMREIADAVPPNAVIAVDTGDHTIWFNRIYQAKRDQTVLVSGRWRTLGFALPAAIAAKLAQPERPVLAIAGDGGSIQTMMEFLTAVEHMLPLTVLILNNASYAMEANRMKKAGLAPLGSSIRNPDFPKLAEACGGAGRERTA